MCRLKWIDSERPRARGDFARAAFYAALVSTITTAYGQEQLSLNDAVREALTSHPLLAAETQRIAVARDFVQQAGLRPNPRLILQSENWSFSGSPSDPIGSTFTDHFLYASQIFETGGKRQRRIDFAQAGVELTTSDRELLARQVATRVKLAYWSAVGAQAVLDLLRATQQNFTQTIQFHETQLREGAIAEAEVIRVRLEGDRVRLAVENASREAEIAQIALFQAMGRDRFAVVRLSDSLERVSEPVPSDLDQALLARVEVRRAREVVDQARAGLRLQQAIARPDVEILSGYKRTAGFNTAMWGAQINLPFFNKNQGNIAAAESEIRVAESRLAATERQVRAEVESAMRDVQKRRDLLASLMARSLRRAQESANIARAAYREGGTDLLRLLDSERVVIELEVQNARLRAEYQQSLVALEAAMGVEP